MTRVLNYSDDLKKCFEILKESNKPMDTLMQACLNYQLQPLFMGAHTGVIGKFEQKQILKDVNDFLSGNAVFEESLHRFKPKGFSDIYGKTIYVSSVKDKRIETTNLSILALKITDKEFIDLVTENGFDFNMFERVDENDKK